MTSTSIPPPNINNGQLGAAFGSATGGQPPGGQPPGGQTQPLPATGIAQQASTYALSQRNQFSGGALPGPGAGGGDDGSYSAIAARFAQSLGIPLGRNQQIVDEQGNFLMTPDQIAEASGGSISEGEAAARFNYLSSAIANEQRRRADRQSIASLETGIGLVQNNARGSLATLQSGLYERLSANYQDQARNIEQTDFSYFIQREQLEYARAIARDVARAARRGAAIGGVLGIVGGIAGLASGNYAAGAQGLAGGAQSLSQAGWF